jgi:hypothetical protein
MGEEEGTGNWKKIVRKKKRKFRNLKRFPKKVSFTLCCHQSDEISFPYIFPAEEKRNKIFWSEELFLYFHIIVFMFE